MKVLVLGAGVIGVSTAWYLAKAGYQVTVVERNNGAAMETSFANAGQLSYGYTTPWAAPGIPLKAFKWLFKKHSPLIFRPDGSLFQCHWLLQMLANCNNDNYIKNKDRMVKVSEYSREMLRRLKNEEDITFEGRSLGTLQVFRTEKEMVAAEKDILVLKEYGVPLTLVDSGKDCAQFEPALARVSHKLAGALHLPNDATGDCYLFTQQLVQKCEQLGVKFINNQSIKKIEHNKGNIVSIITDNQSISADHYICALGSFSRQFFQLLALNIPVYPVKGYSITTAINNESYSPVSTIIDETYKVAITRFDNRIRVGGMAELSGYKIKLNPKRQETLSLVLNDLFPEAGDMSETNFWGGLRSMTPDSVPIIGSVENYQNLWINTGYGTLGWTMCLGGSKLLADLISGNKPEIDSNDLSLRRYSY